MLSATRTSSVFELLLLLFSSFLSMFARCNGMVVICMYIYHSTHSLRSTLTYLYYLPHWLLVPSFSVL